LDFYYKYLLGFGEEDEVEEEIEASSFGSFIHDTLETLYQPYAKYNDKGEIQHEPPRALSSAGIEQMLEQQKSLLKQGFEKHFEKDKNAILEGKNYLSFEVASHLTERFLKAERKLLKSQQGHLFIESLEENITKTIKLDIDGVEKEVCLKGIIDRVDRLNDGVRIIDYKTGKYRPQKTEPPSEKHPLGGDYWRQVVFYKLLLENYHRRDFIVSEGKIDYVEPDIKTGKNQFVNIDFHPNHLRTVTQQITESYAKIMNHEFYEGCGKPHCHWCNFTVKHELRNRYVGELKAELDE
jgi:hypothetical protein